MQELDPHTPLSVHPAVCYHALISMKQCLCFYAGHRHCFDSSRYLHSACQPIIRSLVFPVGSEDGVAMNDHTDVNVKDG